MTIPQHLETEALLLIIEKRDKQIAALALALNEWADVATNGTAYIDNLEEVAGDGPTLFKKFQETRNSINRGIEHCRMATERAKKI